jgi:hypothetical protein
VGGARRALSRRSRSCPALRVCRVVRRGVGGLRVACDQFCCFSFGGGGVAGRCSALCKGLFFCAHRQATAQSEGRARVPGWLARVPQPLPPGALPGCPLATLPAAGSTAHVQCHILRQCASRGSDSRRAKRVTRWCGPNMLWSACRVPPLASPHTLPACRRPDFAPHGTIRTIPFPPDSGVLQHCNASLAVPRAVGDAGPQRKRSSWAATPAASELSVCCSAESQACCRVVSTPELPAARGLIGLGRMHHSVVRDRPGWGRPGARVSTHRASIASPWAAGHTRAARSLGGPHMHSLGLTWRRKRRSACWHSAAATAAAARSSSKAAAAVVGSSSNG